MVQEYLKCVKAHEARLEREKLKSTSSSMNRRLNNNENTTNTSTSSSSSSGSSSTSNTLQKEHRQPCRELSRRYLECRMDKGLMVKDDMKNLGFQNK